MDSARYLSTLRARTRAVRTKADWVSAMLRVHARNANAPPSQGGPSDVDDPTSVAAYHLVYARMMGEKVQNLQRDMERLDGWMSYAREGWTAPWNRENVPVKPGNIRRTAQWQDAGEALSFARSVMRRYRESAIWSFDTVNAGWFDRTTGMLTQPGVLEEAAEAGGRILGRTGRGVVRGASGQGPTSDESVPKEQGVMPPQPTSGGRWGTTLAVAGGLGVAILSGGLILGLMERED